MEQVFEQLKKLKTFRATSAKTLRAVAVETGVSYATVHRIERGGVPSYKTAQRLIEWMNGGLPMQPLTLGDRVSTLEGRVNALEGDHDGVPDSRVGAGSDSSGSAL